MRGLCRGIALIATSLYTTLLTSSMVRDRTINWMWFAFISGVIGVCAIYGWKDQRD